ncbi:hypothetical protein [Bradyrhizobium sp. S3.7.6]
MKVATIAEAAGHLFLTSARFQELVSSGVISKADRGAYDLDRVREQYIKNIRKKASGRSGDAEGLTEARAELTREQTAAVALKNAVSRGEYVPLAQCLRAVETIFATFRERCLAIPGKTASGCEMRSRDEVEEIIRAEIYEALDELTQPILDPNVELGGDSAELVEGSDGGEAAAEPEPD